MDHLDNICLAIITVVACYVLYRIIKWVRRLYFLFKVPGPKQIPFFHNFLDFCSLDAVDLLALFRSWNKKYGPVFLVSAFYVPAINISGPDEFEAVVSTTKNLQKGRVYSMLSLWLGQGLLTSTGTHWQQRRKILTPAFHFSILQQFIQVFNNETSRLVERLKQETTKDATNIIPIMSQTTLYTIAETSFGTKMDENSFENNKYISAIHQMGKLLTYRLIRPWFHNTMIFNAFCSISAKHNELVRIMHKFTDQIIDEKAKTFKTFSVTDDPYNYSKKKRLAFLDLLLNAKIGEGIIDDEGIRDEVNTFMFEGHDTTSSAICFILLLLATHKKYQDSLYEEIIRVLGKSNIHPDLNNLNELKLMERVIKESLRLYPPVAFISRLLDTDITLNGHFIPSETPVSIWIYDIHHNPKYWHDPEKFDPDRFLPDNCIGRHPYSYVPFSAGPRNCIGQKFAMLELKAILCGVLRNYVIETVDTCESIQIVIDLVLRTKGDSLQLKFKSRN